MTILRLNVRKWEVFCVFFNRKSFGRPVKWSDQEILEAVLYILHTGCQWRRLPKEYPPYQTVYHRFRCWQEQGIFEALLKGCLEVLCEQGLKVRAGFVDGTFVRALCGGDHIGITKIGKGSKIMAIVNEQSKPLAALATSSQPHEITLLNDIIHDIPNQAKPYKIVGDKAYDSDHYDHQLKQQGINLIAPHKANRVKSKTQDGRQLRLYKKRYVVERFFAWIKSARRLLCRFDKKLSVFQAFLDLFSIMTLLKHL